MKTWDQHRATHARWKPSSSTSELAYFPFLDTRPIIFLIVTFPKNLACLFNITLAPRLGPWRISICGFYFSQTIRHWLGRDDKAMVSPCDFHMSQPLKCIQTCFKHAAKMFSKCFSSHKKILHQFFWPKIMANKNQKICWVNIHGFNLLTEAFQILGSSSR